MITTFKILLLISLLLLLFSDFSKYIKYLRAFKKVIFKKFAKHEKESNKKIDK